MTKHNKILFGGLVLIVIVIVAVLLLQKQTATAAPVNNAMPKTITQTATAGITGATGQRLPLQPQIPIIQPYNPNSSNQNEIQWFSAGAGLLNGMSNIDWSGGSGISDVTNTTGTDVGTISTDWSAGTVTGDSYGLDPNLTAGDYTSGYGSDLTIGDMSQFN